MSPRLFQEHQDILQQISEELEIAGRASRLKKGRRTIASNKLLRAVPKRQLHDLSPASINRIVLGESVSLKTLKSFFDLLTEVAKSTAKGNVLLRIEALREEVFKWSTAPKDMPPALLANQWCQNQMGAYTINEIREDEEELWRAFWALVMSDPAAEADKHILAGPSKDPITVVGISDPGDFLNAFRDELRGALRSIDLETKLKTSRPGTYLQFFNWISAQMTPLICGFPVYMTRSRRNAWGIIPFGRLRRICVKIHKGLLRTTPLLNNGENGTTEADFRCWVVAALERDEKLRFLVFRGYAIADILCDLVLLGDSPELREAIRNDAIFEQLDSPAALKENLQIASQTERYGTIVVYDPGDREVIEGGGMLEDYQTTVVKLKMEIPVGIGFSLPALPWLLEKYRWRSLRDQMKGFLSLRLQEMNNLGIELYVSNGLSKSRRERE